MTPLERDLLISQILRKEIDTPYDVLLTGWHDDPERSCVKVIDRLERGLGPFRAQMEIRLCLEAHPEHRMLNLLDQLCDVALAEPVALEAYLKILASDEMRALIDASITDAEMAPCGMFLDPAAA